MHDEAKVRLVEAHAERAGGDQRLDPVGEQVVLGPRAIVRLVPAGVGGHRQALLAQEGRGLLRRRDRQRVDDAGPGQLAEAGRQPAQPLVRGGQRHHRQPQRVPVQRPPQHQRLAAGAGTGTGTAPS